MYEFNFPAAPDDTLEVDAVYARENVTLANNETVSLPLTHLNAVREGLVRRSLCPGTHGFFGLAVDPVSDKLRLQLVLTSVATRQIARCGRPGTHDRRQLHVRIRHSPLGPRATGPDRGDTLGRRPRLGLRWRLVRRSNG